MSASLSCGGSTAQQMMLPILLIIGMLLQMASSEPSNCSSLHIMVLMVGNGEPDWPQTKACLVVAQAQGKAVAGS